MTGDDVEARLSEAERLTSAVRRSSRWTVWTYIVHGTLGLAVSPLFAHPEHQPVYWLGIAAWAALLAASQAFVRRRPVEHRSYRARYNMFVRIWFVAWLVMCVAGAVFVHGNLAYWLSGGAVTALIMYAGAVLEFRAIRR